MTSTPHTDRTRFVSTSAATGLRLVHGTAGRRAYEQDRRSDENL